MAVYSLGDAYYQDLKLCFVVVFEEKGLLHEWKCMINLLE